MKQNREETFAGQVVKWNRKEQWACLMYAATAIFITIVYAVLMDYSRIMVSNRLITAGFGCTMGINWYLYGMWYVFSYTWVEGKNGKYAQTLLESIYRMPFSIELYFSVIQKRLVKRMLGIGIVVFLVFLGGMFTGVYSGDMEGNGLGIRMPEQAAGSLLVCIAGTAFTLLCIAAGFFTLKKLHIKQYYKKRAGIHRKVSKKRAKEKKSLWNLPKWFWPGMIAAVLYGAGNSIILECRFAGCSGMECYISGSYDTLLSSAGAVCSLEIFEQLGKCFFGEKWSKGKLAGYLAVLLAVTVCYHTNYVQYFEDRIEVNRFFHTKEYEWEDVCSYTVKDSFWNDIQLELEMEDRTLKVMSGMMYFSEQHDEEYGSDYSYVAALVKQMDGLGIRGTIQDTDKLEKGAQKASEWDENAVSAVRQMEEISGHFGNR